tara:strand:+ start:15415 stop:15690 length:276 start_codon:yes stop_codon:yes gene_type:complete
MDKLEDFRNMIDRIDDKLLLEAGLSLTRDMIRYHQMKKEIDYLEQTFTDGQKAIFYFFADALDEDEIVFAAERISGRIKRMERNSPKKDSE